MVGVWELVIVGRMWCTGGAYRVAAMQMLSTLMGGAFYSLVVEGDLAGSLGPIAFATKGTVRDARGLASMMYGVPSGATAYWMLMRPTTPRRRASLGVQSRMVARADSGMV